jgi:F-type H+-transporting ATPase subunit b
MNEATTTDFIPSETATGQQTLAEGATAHGHGATAVPFYQDPSFLVAFSIVLFVVLTWKHIKRGFLQFTDNYAAKIGKQLQDAAQLRQEAETLLKQYRAEQKKSAQLAEDILSNTKREITALQERSQMELKSLLRARDHQTMEKIARMEAEIMQELRQKTAAMAVEVTQQILQEILDAQRQAILIDQALREMPKQVN